MKDLIKAADTKDLLGECPTWSDKEQALYWVDSRAPALHRLDYATNEVKSWPIPEVVGSFALRAKGGLLLAQLSGLDFFDTVTGKLERVASPEPAGSGCRLNDGKTDRRGRFWVGSKYDLAYEPRGSLFRFDPDHSYTVMEKGITMPNSLCWSPDDRTMYFADSGPKEIYTYPYDIETGTIGKRKLFAKCDWMPDGSTVDSEGYLWNAAYDGWRVTRYAPDGRVDRTIEMPVQRPTSCTFGGPNLDILYITSARQKMPDADLAKQPDAGALFALQTNVRGVLEPYYLG